MPNPTYIDCPPLAWLCLALLLVIVVLGVFLHLSRRENGYLENRAAGLEHQLGRKRGDKVHDNVVTRVARGEVKHFPFGPGVDIHKDDPDCPWPGYPEDRRKP